MRVLIPIGLYTKALQYKFLESIFKDPKEIDITLFTVVTIPITTSLEQEDVTKLPIVEKHREKLEEISTLLQGLGFKVVEKVAFARDVVVK